MCKITIKFNGMEAETWMRRIPQDYFSCFTVACDGDLR